MDTARHGLAVAVSSPDATVSGVWEYDLSTPSLSSPLRLASLPAGAFANGLTVTDNGDLYVADSALSTLWRIPANARPGTAAQAWQNSSLLAPSPATPGLPGANGIHAYAGSLVVSNTAQQLLIRVPVLGGSRPGAAQIVLRGVRIDDFTFDATGGLFAALNQANELVRIFADGSQNVLANSAEGLHNPSSVIFTLDVDGAPALDVTNGAFDGPTPPPSLIRVRLNGLWPDVSRLVEQ